VLVKFHHTMDDCDLEKLSIAPAKLSPKFHRNTTDYEATVPSSIENVKVDCLTSDSGASYQIFVSCKSLVVNLYYTLAICLIQFFHLSLRELEEKK